MSKIVKLRKAAGTAFEAIHCNAEKAKLEGALKEFSMAWKLDGRNYISNLPSGRVRREIILGGDTADMHANIVLRKMSDNMPYDTSKLSHSLGRAITYLSVAGMHSDVAGNDGGRSSLNANEVENRVEMRY